LAAGKNVLRMGRCGGISTKTRASSGQNLVRRKIHLQMRIKSRRKFEPEVKPGASVEAGRKKILRTVRPAARATRWDGEAEFPFAAHRGDANEDSAIQSNFVTV